MTDKTMRQKVLDAVDDKKCLTCKHVDDTVYSCYECDADAILALKVAGVPLSELIEKAESGKLVELDDDQSLPENPYEPFMFWHHPYANKAKVELYGQAQDDMKETGFRRVKVKG